METLFYLQQTKNCISKTKVKCKNMVLLILFLLSFKPISYALDVELLIITPEEFEDYAQILVNKKIQTGSVTNPWLITLESIYADARFDGRDEPEKIKMAIKYFVEHNNTRYVLLLGDGDKFPVRWVNDQEIYFASDLYYADIYNADGSFCSWDYNNNDFFGEQRLGRGSIREVNYVNIDHADLHPDVAVGRIPASTPEELESYIAKVIEYEYKTLHSSWYNNFLLAGGNGRKCDPAIHFLDIYENFPTDFNLITYINQAYYDPVAGEDYRPCDKSDTETYDEYVARTGLNSDQNSLLRNVKSAGNTGRIPDIIFNELGFFGWHDHGIRIIRDYNEDITNYGKYTIGYNDGCSDGTFVGKIPVDEYPVNPPPAILETTSPYNIDIAVPEHMLFAKNNITSRETGWVGAVAATKGLSFPGNGEMMFRFFQSYDNPHPSVGSNRLGDMWRSMVEYWLEDVIFDDAGEFDLHVMFDKYSIDSATWFNKYEMRFGIAQTMANTLFGDPSLQPGGIEPASGFDNTAPNTTDNTDNCWHGNNVTVSFTATDAVSGVRFTRYRVDSSAWINGSSVTINAPDNHSNDGKHFIEYYSVDWAGNMESTNTCVVKIETVPPITTMLLNGKSPFTLLCPCPIGYSCDCPENGCYGDGVEVSMTATDNSSGIEGIYYYFEGSSYGSYAPITYVGPFTRTGGDILGTYIIHYWAVDGAGNHGAERVVDFCVSNMRAGIISEEMEILEGIKEIVSFRAREKYQSPFSDIIAARYEYAIDDEELKWIVIGTDLNAKDGFGMDWNTEQFTNGDYRIRSTYYGQSLTPTPIKTAATLGKIIHQDEFIVTVANFDETAYNFTLQAADTINRGEMIDFNITLKNNSKEDKIMGAQLICKIDKELFDTIQISNYGSLNNSGCPEWHVKLLNPGETWNAHVFGYLKKQLTPGLNIKAQAYILDTDLSIMLSDDPSTPEKGDHTCTKVNSLNATILGYVKNSMNNQPVIAKVCLDGSVNETGYTNSYGKFTFNNLPTGIYSISVIPIDSLYQKQKFDTIAYLKGDGATDTVYLYLRNKDKKAPTSKIKQGINALFSSDTTMIKGIAYDYNPGEGVKEVQISIQRLDNYKYWNGTQWTNTKHWIKTDGAENWSFSKELLQFESGKSYILQTKAVDFAGNEEVPTTFRLMKSIATSKIIFPANTIVNCGNTYFTWSNVNTEYYYLQVANNPQFINPQINMEQTEGTSYTDFGSLDNGTYYCRVKAFNMPVDNPELGPVEGEWSEPVIFSKACNQPDSVNSILEVVDNLMSVYPNPSISYTTIYILNNSYQNVRTQVFSITGALVADLYNSYSNQGVVEVVWNHGDKQTTPGTYIIKSTVGNRNYYSKCIVMNK